MARTTKPHYYCVKQKKGSIVIVCKYHTCVETLHGVSSGVFTLQNKKQKTSYPPFRNENRDNNLPLRIEEVSYS